MALEGRIVKAISNFYDVDTPNGVITCKARGVFKKHALSPLVGDWVEVTVEADGLGVIRAIKPRKNQLFRPPVANMDQVCLVFSVAEPALSLILLDRFLVHVESHQLSAVICFSKIDLLPDQDPETVEQFYRARQIYMDIGYPVVCISVRTGEGLAELAEHLRGKTTVLAGQSGVGKSTLINAFVPERKMETGEISKKLGRGRHTTRHVELLPLPQGGYLVDTPGFSQLDFARITSDNLSSTFPEFARFSDACRFRGCRHWKEPDCRVREAVEEGAIAASRYEHYLVFLQDRLQAEKERW
ncbi:MAG: ribosome small subunit-dependent GTPase A [Bacillaceae bacterium G1]|nr:ribosome small subunit-dependent GTPase A [Bacillota bacterium]OJF17441.1 MAG: ribosome small subunit-dependent GTPase A [Bacillaceae bacterium G1]